LNILAVMVGVRAADQEHVFVAGLEALPENRFDANAPAPRGNSHGAEAVLEAVGSFAEDFLAMSR
jgi:hypothetical protein